MVLMTLRTVVYIEEAIPSTWYHGDMEFRHLPLRRDHRPHFSTNPFRECDLTSCDLRSTSKLKLSAFLA